MSVVKINDNFKKYIVKLFPNIKDYSILDDLLFYGMIGYYLYFIQNTEMNYNIIKYICIFIVIRYSLNYLTSIEDYKSKKIYYQYNIRLAIIILLLIYSSNNIDNLLWIFIVMYTIFTSIFYESISNNILTSIVTLSLIYNVNMNNYF